MPYGRTGSDTAVGSGKGAGDIRVMGMAILVMARFRRLSLIG